MKLVLKESKRHKHVTLQSMIDVNLGLNLIIKTAFRNINGIPATKRLGSLKIYVSDFRSGSLSETLQIAIDNTEIVQMSMGFMGMNMDHVSKPNGADNFSCY